MVSKFRENDGKQLSSARGASKDLTATFMKYRNGSLDSDESDATADPKSRFLVRNTGFSSVKSPEASYVNDRGTLLPTSTKASSEEENNESGLQGASSIQMSARHLPPVYVDIQEEIESNLDEINKQSTYFEMILYHVIFVLHYAIDVFPF